MLRTESAAFDAGCDFCLEFSGKRMPYMDDFVEQGLPNRILLETGSVTSLVGIGALEPGYVLILPNGHFLSVGSLPIEILTEFIVHKARVSEAFRSEFGAVAYFEHGTATRSNPTGACIVHAHLHVVPSRPGFREQLGRDFAEIAVPGIEGLQSLAAEGDSYLYFEEDDGSSFAYRVDRRIRSQYLRWLWALLAGRPNDWDWATFPGYSYMRETFDRLSPRIR